MVHGPTNPHLWETNQTFQPVLEMRDGPSAG